MSRALHLKRPRMYFHGMGPAGLWKGWAPFSVACSEKKGVGLQFEGLLGFRV